MATHYSPIKRPVKKNKLYKFLYEFKDIRASTDEGQYKIPSVTSKGYMTTIEVNTFKGILKNNIPLKGRIDKTYLYILDIEIPLEWFEEIKNTGPSKEPTTMFDLSNCKSYFKYDCSNYKEVTILVNEAIDAGFQLIKTNGDTVEMSTPIQI